MRKYALTLNMIKYTRIYLKNSAEYVRILNVFDAVKITINY